MTRWEVRHPRASGEVNRERILAAIHARPGACFRELTRESGLAAGTVAHHLRVLKRRGSIMEARLGVRRVFYAGTPMSPGETLVARDPALRRLRDWIAAHPGRRQCDLLAAMAPTPRSATQHRLKRLVAAGIVAECPAGLRSHALHLVEVGA